MAGRSFVSNRRAADTAAVQRNISDESPSHARPHQHHITHIRSTATTIALSVQIKAYVEVHMEQGPRLQAAGRALGPVTAISGQSRLQAEIVGEQASSEARMPCNCVGSEAECAQSGRDVASRCIKQIWQHL